MNHSRVGLDIFMGSLSFKELIDSVVFIEVSEFTSVSKRRDSALNIHDFLYLFDRVFKGLDLISADLIRDILRYIWFLDRV